MTKVPFPYHKLELKNTTDKHYWVSCPFHTGDNEASMCINIDEPYKLYFKCFGCGAYGSPKQFAKKMKLNPNGVGESTKKEIKKPTINWDKRLKDKIKGSFSEIILAKGIGVKKETLQNFQVAFDKNSGHYLIPMFQNKGICGIQEQWFKDDGIRKKKTQRYSQHGWFFPQFTWDITQPLYIAEGFSDTTVLLDMNLQTIGRYNALAQKLLSGIVNFDQVIIVSDNDDVGKGGSYSLSDKIPHSKVIMVNEYKDIREMYLAEGTEKTKRFLGV